MHEWALDIFLQSSSSHFAMFEYYTVKLFYDIKTYHIILLYNTFDRLMTMKFMNKSHCQNYWLTKDNLIISDVKIIKIVLSCYHSVGI